MKKIEQGKVSQERAKKILTLSEWEIHLIRIFSVCARSDGIDIQGLKIFFKSSGLKSEYLLHDTILILSRVYHYLEE